MPVTQETKTFLDDVKKKGKARKFAMICKGVKILSLIVYKKGTEQSYKEKAKKDGKGKFFGGVVTGQGMDIRFQLESDKYPKPPGKELILKDFLKSECDLKCKPSYEIVEELDFVDESDDDDNANTITATQAAEPTDAVEVDDAPTVDAGDIQKKLDELGPKIKTFVADFPDQRVAILKPTKAVKDYLLVPENGDRSAAETALQEIEALVNKQAEQSASAPVFDATEMASDLKELAPGIKQFITDHPTRSKDVLGPTKIVKDFLANPAAGSIEQAESALMSIKELVSNGDAESSGANEADWKTEAKKIAPKLKEALSNNIGDTSKLRASFAYAKEKADAGDYDSALKSLERVSQLIEDGYAATQGPEAEFAKVAKNAQFQVRRLQFALRGYEQELRGELKDLEENQRQVHEIAMKNVLKIADGLDEVVNRFAADLPALDQGEQRNKFIDDLQEFLKSEIVQAVEKPNPFKLEVDVVGPITESLNNLNPVGAR